MNQLINVFDGRKYIVKPSAGSLQKGIFLTRDYEGLVGVDFTKRGADVSDYSYKELKESSVLRGLSTKGNTQVLRNRLTSHLNNKKRFLLQEYIEPLLYDNRHFNIRLYVLIVLNDRDLKVYVPKTGHYMNLSGNEYDHESLSMDVATIGLADVRRQMAVRQATSGGTYGDCISIHQPFPENFVKKFGSKVTSDVIDQIHKIAHNTMRACMPTILKNNIRKIQHGNETIYRLLGYDIIIDPNYRCFLAEINTKPNHVLDKNGENEKFFNLFDALFFPHQDSQLSTCVGSFSYSHPKSHKLLGRTQKRKRVQKRTHKKSKK